MQRHVLFDLLSLKLNSRRTLHFEITKSQRASLERDRHQQAHLESWLIKAGKGGSGRQGFHLGRCEYYFISFSVCSATCLCIQHAKMIIVYAFEDAVT